MSQWAQARLTKYEFRRSGLTYLSPFSTYSLSYCRKTYKSGCGMDNTRKAIVSSSTPQTSKGADLLIGLMERNDELTGSVTPLAEFKPISLPVYASEEPSDNCHCRKSRCLKL
jgi:hypothetical protein